MTTLEEIMLPEDLWDEVARDERDIVVPLTQKEALA